MGCCEQDNQGPEATARPRHVSNQGGAPRVPRARPHPHSHPTHHIQRVEAGERGSDASNGLGAAGQQLLQGPRAAQLLLHLLGAGQLGGDVGALHCPRPLQQQPRLPVLRERESDRPITARFSLLPLHFLTGTSPAWQGREWHGERGTRGPATAPGSSTARLLRCLPLHPPPQHFQPTALSALCHYHLQPTVLVHSLGQKIICSSSLNALSRR